MNEEEYFASRSGDDTNKLLREYCRTFHGPYYNIEETGIHLSPAELRADLLHCLYHNKPKDQISQPGKHLIELAHAN
ncbi:MAG: hypothetical protein E7D48_04145 [Bifidobacterium scardovii]|jgi:hypothetical protein|uniref:hypothetical protein n=1 Tax=Bifidobacterium scardovii TaxID=158787 RepID=UPI0020527A5E|nr:hypothetical protein [Bifidobacterium scardovii]MDU2421292.1 hypothetical protein [Bifidobacterium scardovii]DAZ29446.1 MAG TPA: hypothetical protein [Caudoviricetes sp.]